jgi:hypothetical protein
MTDEDFLVRYTSGFYQNLDGGHFRLTPYTGRVHFLI